ncbi:gp49 [Mycobacteroides abscessus subsp. massiliense]|nr:gp49 [Mycobacteroides abscessus subsp. massiliense]
MRFNGDYLYRVRVVSYPSGSHQQVVYGGEIHTEPVPGWRPPGWRPVGRYVEMLNTDEFVWPVTHHTYGSRSTAKKRADLLESYGATVVIERSSRITWPELIESAS